MKHSSAPGAGVCFQKQNGQNGLSYSDSYAWLSGPAADLKAAMCQEMSLIYEPVCQVLNDLEYQYAEMVRLWHEFALNAGIQEVTLPPHYQVSENTRNLLAYTVQIARQRSRPLVGLQRMFP